MLWLDVICLDLLYIYIYMGCYYCVSKLGLNSGETIYGHKFAHRSSARVHTWTMWVPLWLQPTVTGRRIPWLLATRRFDLWKLSIRNIDQHNAWSNNKMAGLAWPGHSCFSPTAAHQTTQRGPCAPEMARCCLPWRNKGYQWVSYVSCSTWFLFGLASHTQMIRTKAGYSHLSCGFSACPSKDAFSEWRRWQVAKRFVDFFWNVGSS